MQTCCDPSHHSLPSSRRALFRRGLALGAGVGLLGLLPQARSSGGTEALLLSCMDYRLMDEIEDYMHGRGMRDKYDHIVLAGASLGAITDRYPAWNQTFWQHLEIAIQLHKIRKVMVMDHRDCGAYRVILGPEVTKDAKTELDTHAAQLRKLRAMLKEKYPQLEVETLLMSLDGKVETVA